MQRRTLLLVFLLLLSLPSVAEADWSSFQNDTVNTGVASSDVPVENATVDWTYEAPDGISLAASSPVVVDERIYVGGFTRNRDADTEDAYPANRTGYLLTLNATTGEPTQTVELQGGVWSSPSVVGDTVYVGTLDGYVYAVSKSGEVDWVFEAGAPVFSSPVVSDGTVYLGTRDLDTYEPSHRERPFYALDAADGSVVWKTGVEEGVMGSAAVKDDELYVGGQNGSLLAFDIHEGDLLWELKTRGSSETSHDERPRVEHGGITSPPTVADESIYFGTYAGRAYAVDRDGGELWNTSMDGVVYSSPAVHDGTAYFGNYDANLYAFDTETGEETWSFPADSRVSKSSPATDGETVVFGSVAGSLYAVNTTDGSELWSYATGERVLSSPSIYDGELLFTGERTVYSVTEGTTEQGFPNSSGARDRENTSTVSLIDGDEGVDGSRDDGVERYPYGILALALVLSASAVVAAVRSNR